MLNGDLYRDDDPELVAERKHCQALLDRFHAVEAEGRHAVLTQLLGGIGEGS